MKINIDNPNQLMSHFVLHDADVAKEVSETEQWKKEKTITATVQFNGVSVPAHVMEQVLQDLFRQTQEHYRKEYNADNFDTAVTLACEKKIKDTMQKVMEAAQLFVDTVDYQYYSDGKL